MELREHWTLIFWVWKHQKQLHIRLEYHLPNWNFRSIPFWDETRMIRTDGHTGGKGLHYNGSIVGRGMRINCGNDWQAYAVCKEEERERERLVGQMASALTTAAANTVPYPYTHMPNRMHITKPWFCRHSTLYTWKKLSLLLIMWSTACH